MKIAILYICIGRYSVMWEEFYQTSKRYLFDDDDKDYYVFTDDVLIAQLDLPDVTVKTVKDLGWPGNSLYRFRMFLQVADEMESYDYIYYFNANACFVKPISSEIIPQGSASIIAAQHFRQEGIDNIKYGYDRNKKSTAFVQWGQEGQHYVQACFIGASGSEMLHMCRELAANIDIDEKNGVTAKWHDESHFNKYLIGKVYTLLPVSYVYPEILNLPIEVNILMRSKERYADLCVLRYGKKRVMQAFVEKLLYQWRKIENECHYIFKKLGRY